MRAVRSAIHASTKSCPMSPVLGQIVPHAPETNVKISWQTCRAAVLRTPASFPQAAIIDLAQGAPQDSLGFPRAPQEARGVSRSL